jgi:DNA invertase Pin-like site-specific DNA recombinase
MAENEKRTPKVEFDGSVSYISAAGKKVKIKPPKDVPHLYRVAIYCRVSTSQKEQMDSLNAQIEYYRNYVDRRRDWVLVGEYADIKSGRSADARAQFMQLISSCEEGNVDIVITKTVSRFGRNTVDTIEILRKLKSLNVDVFFENEGLHSIDPKNELVISIAEAIAQADSESRSENILWGIKRSAADPNAPLYARPCYGYRKDEEGQLAIHESEACTVKLIFDMYLSGSSVLNIKRELERREVLTPTGKPVWPKRTIETILANEKYAGDVRLFKTYSAGFPDKRRFKNNGERDECIGHDMHPGIVTKEQFEQVQRERALRSNVAVDTDGNANRKATHYSMKQKRDMNGPECGQKCNEDD